MEARCVVNRAVQQAKHHILILPCKAAADAVSIRDAESMIGVHAPVLPYAKGRNLFTPKCPIHGDHVGIWEKRVRCPTYIVQGQGSRDFVRSFLSPRSHKKYSS